MSSLLTFLGIVLLISIGVAAMFYLDYRQQRAMRSLTESIKK